MRDEGLVILEWVAHYRALGFDTIVVYTNDNTDGSDDLLVGSVRRQSGSTSGSCVAR